LASVTRTTLPGKRTSEGTAYIAAIAFSSRASSAATYLSKNCSTLSIVAAVSSRYQRTSCRTAIGHSFAAPERLRRLDLTVLGD
jgi:hypothetical protein